MESHETYWPGEAETSFDAALIETVADHLNREAHGLPTLYGVIDPEAISILVRADTRMNLDFDIDIPGRGLGADGEPATSVTVVLETRPDDAVHITVTDDGKDPGGVGAAPRIR